MAVLDANGVPILALSEDTRAAVSDAHAQGALLTGQVAALENILPVHPPPGGGPDVAVFHVGGETLDEAAKSIVGCFDSTYAHRAPPRLACTDQSLACVLAEHYGAQIVEIDELLAAPEPTPEEPAT